MALMFASPAAAKSESQNSITSLEAKLKTDYQKIEKIIAKPPGGSLVVEVYKRRLREWQDDLAQSFAAAANTISEILKLNPPNRQFWEERLETVQLYSQPVSPPEMRSVFGAGEVQQSAMIREMPAAASTPEAIAAKTSGDVRLRLVLAADGQVKYVFPIKSMGSGLTESAMSAARLIKFEPALRQEKPVSQFITLVYEFKNGKARSPYIPRTVF